MAKAAPHRYFSAPRYSAGSRRKVQVRVPVIDSGAVAVQAVIAQPDEHTPAVYGLEILVPSVRHVDRFDVGAPVEGQQLRSDLVEVRGIVATVLCALLNCRFRRDKC